MNYYEVLNVAKDATNDDIKRSYQKLILQHHPDKNENTKDLDVFIRIDEAYKVLRDPECRKTYDSQLFQQKSNIIIHDTVRSSDFQLDEENEEYFHICKCGGLYIHDINCKDSEYIISCDECSLAIKVINENYKR